MEKKKKVTIIALVIVIIAGLTISMLTFIMMSGIGPIPPPYIGQRKALICCSANDFYDSEPDGQFNDGNDSHLTSGIVNWTFSGENSIGSHSPVEGYDGPPLGCLFTRSLIGGETYGVHSLNWTESNYTLHEYAFYNISAMIRIFNTSAILGNGVRIGLQWLNSERSIIRTDWSAYINNTNQEWNSLSVTGVCNNQSGNEITELKLLLSVNATFINFVTDTIYFDDIKIYKWVLVDLNNPTDPGTPPPPSGINSDGFPAQALQVYWILKNHGYTDDNIFLMLYYKNDADGIIDISKFDTYSDDLEHDGVPAVIDIANDSVTAARFKQELNVSHSGSFASKIHPEDYLIIYMCDHGSNKILADGNATFHFEADHSFITEFEFYNLVKEIECQRMMINVDCCFSGNFLNANANVGASWYDIENCIFVSASANLLSWYYINNNNVDGFAGSWFFHIFWDVLDHNGTIDTAYVIASNWVPFVRGIPLFVIQMPLMYDNMGINMTLSFDSDPPL